MWYHRFFFYFKKRERDFEYQYNSYIQTPIRAFNPFREQVNETNSTKLKTRDKAYFLLLTRGGQRSRT